MNNHGNDGSGAQGPMTLATFLMVNPPKFKGTTSPTEADTWFQALERALQAQMVPEGQCVEFATYMLIGEGAPGDFEEWKCIKYEGGLRSDIFSSVGPMEIRTFLELVNKRGQVRRFGKQPQNKQACARCESHHSGAPCKTEWGLCYSCGKAGHKATNYPEKQKQGAGRAQQPGRVFTTSVVGAEGSETLIRGNCEIAGQILNALFDLGATHSFIAFKKASELGLKIVVLGYDLKVYNSTHEAMVTRLGCPQVSFRVQQHDFVHDLICLPMIGLDLILGLDWLSENHVLLNCSAKLVCFMPEDTEGPVVVNSYYLNSMMVNCSGTECQRILLLIAGVSGDDQRLEQILVVCEFPEVFPKDIDEFSPNQEVEFAIELVPGVGPISSAPYRMSPLEMTELKSQLEDLLGKNFI
ncbi:uncharacterized protein LOC107491474 [Arachis duranensis]|uniref:Uncharacterized protein LOC107491474 n=1 Tax=Arachis duranensis TaxID=130453 RepID=A0A6P4DPU3_ARADU|nr:uncharacterized protein LOC107491474 [Arachis duranensis]